MASKAIARAKQTAQRVSNGRKFMGGPDEGSLATRPAVPVGSPQLTNDSNEINDLFRGLRQQATPRGYRRPIVRRGLSGQELNPDGSDPGSGMAWFDRNNSEAQVNERLARVGRDDARRYAQRDQLGASAVAERKALQEMGGAPFQQSNPNLVKGADGYMDLFSPEGRILGSTRPQGQVPGFGDPTNTTLESQRASQGMQNMFQKNFRAGNSPGAMAPNAGPQLQQQAPPQPRGDFLTPGGGGGPTVGGSSSQGAPAGGTSFNMNLPVRPTEAGEMDVPSSGRNFGANWLSPMQGPPQPGPSTVDPFSLQSSYPKLPYGSPEQLATLQQLNKFSTGTSPGAAALEAKWNNVLPNAPDNAQLQMLFPDIFAQNPSVYQAWKQLLAMSKQPEYQMQYGLR